MSERFSNTNIPALIIGAGLTPLGVIRSLRRENIPTFYVSPKIDLASRSRWCNKTLITEKLILDSNSLSNFLEKLQIDKGILFPCSDLTVKAVAMLESHFKTRFLSSIPSLICIRSLQDKGELAQILIKYNLPHPKTYILEKQNDLNNLQEADFEGAFLKPRNSQQFLKHFGVKAFQINNREDAISKAEEIQKAGYALVLQEYIPGAKSNHYFIDGFINRFGDMKACFARRRMRMYPFDFGNSSYMYSVPLGEVANAVDSIKFLLKSINYRGIYSAEFKYDERDGLFKLIEVNVRPWWYVEFATRCGVNVCKLAYQDALEQDVDSIENYKIGKKLVYLYYDFACCSQLYRDKKLTLWRWFKSWWGAIHPIFRWDDPLPSIVNTYSWIRNLINNRFTKR